MDENASSDPFAWAKGMFGGKKGSDAGASEDKSSKADSKAAGSKAAAAKAEKKWPWG